MFRRDNFEQADFEETSSYSRGDDSIHQEEIQMWGINSLWVVTEALSSNFSSKSEVRHKEALSPRCVCLQHFPGKGKRGAREHYWERLGKKGGWNQKSANVLEPKEEFILRSCIYSSVPNTAVKCKILMPEKHLLGLVVWESDRTLIRSVYWREKAKLIFKGWEKMRGRACICTVESTLQEWGGGRVERDRETEICGAGVGVLNTLCLLKGWISTWLRATERIQLRAWAGTHHEKKRFLIK